MEVTSEVHDLHGLAHVEYEDLAAPPQCARLENELRRLGDGHEIAAHLPVGHCGDRSALWDLASRKVGMTELRDPSTLPNRTDTKLRCSAAVAAPAATMPLGDPFRGPHDRRGAHGLVGRDVDEVDFLSRRRVPRRRRTRAERIVVGDGLGTMFSLHEGHVFVRGGVEERRTDGDRPRIGVNAARVANVGDDGDQAQGRKGLPQLTMNFKDLVSPVSSAINVDGPRPRFADRVSADRRIPPRP